MPKATVKFTLTPGGCLIRVSVDHKRINFVSDKGSIELLMGKPYSLVWFVEGLPGSKYKIEITEPTQSKTVLSYTLDDSGKDGGQVWINV